MNRAPLSAQLQAIADTATRIYARAHELGADVIFESELTTLLSHASALQTLGESVDRDVETQNVRLEAASQALHDANAYLRVIFDNIKDYAVFTIGLDKLITHWNIGAERVFGWPESEAVGQPAAMIFTPEDRAQHAPELEILAAIERGYAEDKRWHLRKDGSRFFANGTLRQLLDPQGRLRGFIKVARDATVERERQEAQDTLAADLHDMQILHNLSVQLVPESDVQVFYDAIMSAAVSLTRADAGTVHIYNESANELVLLASQGFDDGLQSYLTRIAVGSNSSCSVALMTGQRTFYDFDAPDDPDGSLGRHLEAGYRSVQSTPLITRAGRPIGVFSTHWRVHHRPSERELRFLDLLARQAADLIEQQQTETALRESRTRLELALDAAHMTAWEWYPEFDKAIASPSVSEVLGLEPGTSLDSSSDYFRLVYSEDRERYEALVHHAVKVGENWHTEYRIIRPCDGRLAWMEERATVTRDPETGRVRTTGLIWDITLQKQIEAHERERRVLAESLRDTAAELSSTLKLDELLVQALRLARRFAPCDSGLVVLVDSDGMLGHFHSDRLSDKERHAIEVWHRQHTSYISIPLYQTAAQMAQVEPVSGAALNDIPLTKPVHSLLIVPLVRQRDVIAFVVLIDRQGSGFVQVDFAALQAFAYQLTTAISNAKLFVQAQDLAALQERQQFARDLHDSVSQTLFAASLLIEALPMLWDQRSEQIPQLLSDVNRLIKGAQAEMRTLLLELRPVNLQSTPLRRLIGQLIDTIQGRTRIDVALTFEGDPVLPWEVHVAVYRIVQEALNNIAKHAQASHVWVTVVGGENHIELNINDDGAGFAADNLKAGLGLQMMRERAELINAALVVHSQPGRGTEISLRWISAEPASE